MRTARSRSSRRSTTSKTGCCPVEVRPFETPLSKMFLFDPFPPSGAIHDVDPFGVFQTGEGGSVIFRQVLRSAPAYVKCGTPNELDALIAKVLLAAVRHTGRDIPVTEEYVSSFTGRAGKHVFSGSPIQNKNVDHHVVPALKESVVLIINEENPEDLGRLCYSCGMYGVSLIDPWRVSAIEVVRKPFGLRENTQVVG